MTTTDRQNQILGIIAGTLGTFGLGYNVATGSLGGGVLSGIVVALAIAIEEKARRRHRKKHHDHH